MGERKDRLGLVSVSFRNQSPRRILQAASEANLSCIEWGSDVHAPARDRERLREIADMQREYGIFCSSYGTYFRLGETPLDELPFYTEAAKTLGTDVLRLWCGSRSGDEYEPSERQTLYEECRKAAEIAAREQVTLCMECHKKTYTQIPEDALALMREIGSPHFRMYWQPFQWQSVEENRRYAEAIAPYVRNIHVFQWKGDGRFSLFEGIDEWKGYLGFFPTPRTLLLEFMPDDKIESLSEEANALRIITEDRI